MVVLKFPEHPRSGKKTDTSQLPSTNTSQEVGDILESKTTLTSPLIFEREKTWKVLQIEHFFEEASRDLKTTYGVLYNFPGANGIKTTCIQELSGAKALLEHLQLKDPVGIFIALDVIFLKRMTFLLEQQLILDLFPKTTSPETDTFLDECVEFFTDDKTQEMMYKFCGEMKTLFSLENEEILLRAVSFICIMGMMQAFDYLEKDVKIRYLPDQKRHLISQALYREDVKTILQTYCVPKKMDPGHKNIS